MHTNNLWHAIWQAKPFGFRMTMKIQFGFMLCSFIWLLNRPINLRQHEANLNNGESINKQVRTCTALLENVEPISNEGFKRWWVKGSISTSRRVARYLWSRRPFWVTSSGALPIKEITLKFQFRLNTSVYMFYYISLITTKIYGVLNSIELYSLGLVPCHIVWFKIIANKNYI